MAMPARSGSKLLRTVLSLVAAASATITLAAGAHAEGSAGNGPVDPFFGSFGTSVAIDVPSNHGFEPQISLSYNSQLGNGRVGVGWGLSGFATIERASPGKGAPRYDASDTFLLDGQELVPCTTLGGTHCTKIQSYRRITWDGAANAWYVWDKDGTKLTFAALYQTGSGTFRWAMTAASDARGNTVSYGYWCDPGNDCYASSVTYNGNAVNLYWELRSDPITFATGASIGTTNYRLKTLEVKAGGARARAYRLNYGASSASRSVLTSVQQFGADAALDAGGTVSGGSALPPKTFGYAGTAPSIGGWQWASSGSYSSCQLLYGDFNGDGKTDIYCHRRPGDSSSDLMALSTGSGFTGWMWASPGSYSSCQIQLGDFNGDGKTDVYCSRYAGDASSDLMALSTGSGFTGWVWSSAGSYSSCQMVLGDYNGDGKTDIYCSRRAGDSSSDLMALSTGSGFTGWLWSSPGSYSSCQLLTGDFNGDGKSDIYCSRRPGDTSSDLMALSTGSGFAGWSWSSPGSYSSCQLLLGDFNGDGKKDIYCSRRSGDASSDLMALSTGSGFAGWGWSSPGSYSSCQMQLGDFNGDGKADLYCSRRSGDLSGDLMALSLGSSFAGWSWSSSGSYSSCQLGLGDFDGDGQSDIYCSRRSGDLSSDLMALTSSHGTEMLTSAGNGHGGTTSIAYTPSSSYSNTYLPTGMLFPTVQSVTSTDGRGSSSTTSYAYAGGLWSDAERRFLGFRKVTSVIDAAGDYTETYYHQHVGCISKPEVTYYRDAAGNIFKYSTYGYQESATAPYTSLMTDRWEYECNQSASCRRTLLQIGYDQYGNGSTTYEWGDYDVAGDERTSVRAAIPNVGAYIVGLPAYENVYAGIGTGGALLKQSLYVYDGNGSYATPPTRGLLTTRQGWNSQTGGYVSRSYGYDAWGNTVAETDEKGQTSRRSYDPVGHVHEVQRCNALGQCSSKSWLGTFDVLSSETDANGNVTSYGYDALFRPTTTTQSNGTVESLSYLDWGNASLQRVRKTVSDGTADGLWTETYEDGAGRVWRTVKEGGQTQDTLYSDASKRVWKKSSWYAPGETPQYQTNGYDGLGRLRTVTNADGTGGSIAYGNGYSASYDELGHERVSWTDGYGATSQVRERNGSAYYFTTYAHDLLGNLTKVTDANGNVTQATWDSLGRKVAGCDPDTGCSSYQYDATGALVWRRDAKGQATTIAFDAGGRPVQRVLADGTSITWTYDEAGHGASKGRLTSISDASGTEARVYDAAGNITSSTKCVTGNCATTGFTYDVSGRPSSITYPSGEVVSYGYDATGRVTSVGGYVNSIQYNGRGQITQVGYANGTTASYGYAAARGWLSSSTLTGVGGATLYSMGYAYDAAARVTSTSSSTHALSNLGYGYDELNRLTSVTGAQSQGFAYDAIGNMTSNSAIGAYAYGDSTHVHATTAAGANGYSYDANGNQITGAGRTLSWTAEDRLAAVTANGRAVSYAYDHAGERVKRVSQSETRYYFSRLAERDGVGTWTNNVYAGDVLVGRSVGGAKRWHHGDHLGSTRVITDASGQAIQSYEYAAYGTQVGGSGATGNTRTFAGQDVDVDSGLTYMRARFYDAWLGRFVSADTIVPDAKSPQAFNRYAYVFNNPIANTDPTGHVPVVAAIAVATSVGVAAGVTSTVFVVAVVGAATTTVGYFAHDPTLMSIGGVLLGAASGFQFGAGFLANAQSVAAGVWGGGISALTSPISPLSPDLKSAIGWAYAAQGMLYQYEHISDTVNDVASKNQVAVDRTAVQAKLDELEKTRPLDYALKSDSAAWSSAQKLYGEAMSRITGGVITPGEAIALNPTGGLVGPGGGALEQFLDPSTGWIPGVRIHSVLHDAYGWLGSTVKQADQWTIGGLGVGPGYFYAGYNFFGMSSTNPLAGQVEGIARNGGFSVNALFGRMY
jgi:RHS repeat-associated protein